MYEFLIKILVPFGNKEVRIINVQHIMSESTNSMFLFQFVRTFIEKNLFNKHLRYSKHKCYIFNLE